MTKYICDRCGNEMGEHKNVIRTFRIRVDSETFIGKPKGKELCDRCTKDIERFMEGQDK